MAAAASPVQQKEESKENQFVINLSEDYAKDLQKLRDHLKNNRAGSIAVRLNLPSKSAGFVLLQLRCSDAYVIGFRGVGGWYHFAGEQGGWGKCCNVSVNYANLPRGINVSLLSLNHLAGLATFPSKKNLDGTRIAIAAAVVSEALRFQPVQNLFATLCTNGYPEVPLTPLKNKYFKNWAKISKYKWVLMKPLQK